MMDHESDWLRYALGPKGPSKKPKKGKYWYLFTIETCVLCGATETRKERQYTPKPKHWTQRYIFIDKACGEHFL